ncbi:MAG: hypothetical protein Q7J16_08460 [Candidatus Cloacimonadales bacterium]|nr:hypothetical protein [Candidatus Cloacimonadales bacterium]
MKSSVMMAALFLSALFILSCNGDKVVGSDDVQLLQGAEFTITEYVFTSSELIAKGTIANNGSSIYYPPWYIEAEFYADSTFTLKFGGATTVKNYSLAPGEITLWQLKYSSDLIVESDYPDFAIKNLRAYVEE